MKLGELKKKYIEALYKEKAFIIKKDYIKLHHGGESHLYMNHSIFLSSYKNFELLSQIYLQLLPKTLKNYKFGCVDSVMSPVICGFLASLLKKDIVIIKEKKMEHGTENKIYGNPTGEIVLIDDVTTTGTILINAARALKEKGADIHYAILAACRDLTAVDKLKTVGIKTYFIASYEEISQVLWDNLSTQEKEIIKSEIKEKKYNWKLSN
ncbi:hypothetical protein A2773_00260 [Candidatus Gottesmanbacteria bacterium RIFCSPHIGHO2_01_FULL_39_10]|uniref:Orotate phosphoribosyltransferase n=1 Tax=Candidatus Gottesmanbacteria bacterium RIFCSPHIGHO2_01_FULL_39_10 TaxID=1798375 RepID=A0A1F5ZKM6_9BACT|nr:MAG: hypothetical protein A2773_00260 [Candidatus Gottesmanbacteria bacterium RIFCSPHIGHO2_01_FULL_39_10]